MFPLRSPVIAKGPLYFTGRRLFLKSGSSSICSGVYTSHSGPKPVLYRPWAGSLVLPRQCRLTSWKGWRVFPSSILAEFGVESAIYSKQLVVYSHIFIFHVLSYGVFGDTRIFAGTVVSYKMLLYMGSYVSVGSLEVTKVTPGTTSVQIDEGATNLCIGVWGDPSGMKKFLQ